MPSSASGGAASFVRRRNRPLSNVGGSRVSGLASGAGAVQRLMIAFHSASAWACESVKSLALSITLSTIHQTAAVGPPTQTVRNKSETPRQPTGLTHHRFFRFGFAAFGSGGGTTTFNSGSTTSLSARSNSPIVRNRSAGSFANAFKQVASTPLSTHG